MPGLPGDRTITSEAGVTGLSFTADGALLAAPCEDGQVRLWDARTGELKRAIPFDKETKTITLSDRADLLAGVGRDGSIKFWDLKTGQISRHFAGPTAAMRTLAFAPDRKLVAGAARSRATGSEYTVRIWNDLGTQQATLPAGLGGISTIAFSPDGRTIVATGLDTDLRAWNTQNGELLRVMDDLPLATFAMGFSPDGKYLATAGADRILYLWDTGT